VDRLSDRGGHQRSALIEIVFGWADRVTAAAAVGGGVLSGQSAIRGQRPYYWRPLGGKVGGGFSF
jgi:hypothetical protein